MSESGLGGAMMRRRTYFVICLFFVLFFYGSVRAAEHAGEETKRHFLWSMKTEKNTMFFLGALHVLQKDAYPLPEEIERAYENARKIVFETDVDMTRDPRWQGRMMGLGLYLRGQTIADHVSKETYTLLEEKVTAAGMQMLAFDRFRPWFCALTLTVMELQRLGFDAAYGIDMHFHEKAKKDGKEIIALEPLEYQLRLFTSLSEGEQEAFLRQTLEELEVIGTMASDMAKAWKAGDVEALGTIMTLSFKDHPDMYDRFVVARNRNWIPRIDELAGQDGNVLVIVGAAHLVGRNSVLDLLKKKGYAIDQR